MGYQRRTFFTSRKEYSRALIGSIGEYTLSHRTPASRGLNGGSSPIPQLLASRSGGRRKPGSSLAMWAPTGSEGRGGVRKKDTSLSSGEPEGAKGRRRGET